MKHLLGRLLKSPWFRVAALLLGITAMIAFGIIGVGRKEGFAESGFDMKFLYVAGRTWLQGLDAYNLAARQAATGSLATNIYAFAYPPQVFPLCVFLGIFPLEKARLLMLLLNVLAAIALAFFCVRLVYRGEVKQLNHPDSSVQWIIPAIILGNPFTAHVLWMGQTTLITITALVAGWYFSRRDRWFVSGLLIAVTTIKPQVSLLIILWLVLERRWRLLSVTAVTILVCCLVPMSIAGSIDVFLHWLQEIKVYKASPFNALGFEHVFGLQNTLYIAGIKLPSLVPIAVVLTGVLWCQRSKLLADDVFGLLLCVLFLFGQSHDYDLVALAPLVPTFWRHLYGRDDAVMVALALFVAMFVPQRLLQPLKIDLLLQFRFFIVLALAIWLLRLSVQRKSDIRSLVPEEQLTT